MVIQWDGSVVAQLVWRCDGSVGGGLVAHLVEVSRLRWWKCGGSFSRGVMDKLVKVWKLSWWRCGNSVGWKCGGSVGLEV